MMTTQAGGNTMMVQAAPQNPAVNAATQAYLQARCCGCVDLRSGVIAISILNIILAIWAGVETEWWWLISVVVSFCGLYGGIVKNACLVRVFGGWLIFEAVIYCIIAFVFWLVQSLCDNIDEYDYDNSSTYDDDAEDTCQTLFFILGLIFFAITVLHGYWSYVCFKFAGLVDQMTYAQNAAPQTQMVVVSSMPMQQQGTQMQVTASGPYVMQQQQQPQQGTGAAPPAYATSGEVYPRV
jgi:hypothetical protein